MYKILISVVLLLSFFVMNSYSVEPNEILENKDLEKRARNISKLVKCLVCQNETVDESNADLAKQLRIVIREQLLLEKTDKEVLDFLISRYGEFVLLEPKVNSTTYVLWFSPVIFLIISFFLFMKFFSGKEEYQKLTNEEKEILNKLK